MASEGPRGPTAGANTAGIGTIAWATPGAVTAADATPATADGGPGGGTSNYLVASGFGFAIPAGATVTGIVVEWLRKYTGGGAADAAARIVKTAVGAADRSAAAAWPFSYTYAAFGGVSDLWGETWAPADVNAAAFGAALAATVNPTTTAEVDYCRVTVYYTPAGGEPPVPQTRVVAPPPAPAVYDQ